MVSNFVSGLILLAERPIRVGDIISVKGEEGRVLRIHVRATEIETGDRANVIIPNSELITQVVKNRTHTDTFARVTVPVGVAYGRDVAKVRDILLDIAKSHPHVMPTPAPTVFLTGFGESAINFELGWVVRNIGDGAGYQERYLLLDPGAVPGRGHRYALSHSAISASRAWNPTNLSDEARGPKKAERTVISGSGG